MRTVAWAVKNRQHYLRDEEGLPILFRTKQRAEEAIERAGGDGFRVEKVIVKIEEML